MTRFYDFFIALI